MLILYCPSPSAYRSVPFTHSHPCHCNVRNRFKPNATWNLLAMEESPTEPDLFFHFYLTLTLIFSHPPPGLRLVISDQWLIEPRCRR